MFTFFAAVVSLVWIQQHLALVIGILAAIIILIIYFVHRRRAYLALPVLFIGNKATKTFHCLDCPQLARVIPQNKVAFRLPAETARMGYHPCGTCSPRWPS